MQLCVLFASHVVSSLQKPDGAAEFAPRTITSLCAVLQNRPRHSHFLLSLSILAQSRCARRTAMGFRSSQEITAHLAGGGRKPSERLLVAVAAV